MNKIRSFTLISSILSFSILIIYDSLLTSKSYSKPSMEFLVKNPYPNIIAQSPILQDMFEEAGRDLIRPRVDLIQPDTNPPSGCKCEPTQNPEARSKGLRYVCINEDGFKFYNQRSNCRGIF